MGFSAVQRVVGFLIAGSSLMMLPPVLVSLWYHDGTVTLFLVSAALLLVSGVADLLPGPKRPPGTAAARRIPDRGQRLAGAGTGRRRAVRAADFAAAQLRRRRVRVHVRAHHDRRHHRHQHRRTAAGGSVLPAAAAVARRHGHHRAGRRHPAHAENRRHAAVPGRDTRAR